jgi:thiol-disulfide isomerase/thioredoxin
MRTLLAVLLSGTLLLGACGSSDAPSTEPTFGGQRPSAETALDTPELAAAREAAGLDPCPETGDDAARDDGLPDVTLPCLGGGADVRLAGLRGRPHVVNLWATWCPPCREELPVLQAAHTALGDRVGFVGVDYADPDPAGALALAQRSGVTYPVVSDPDESLRKALSVIGLPQTVFVDPQGRVVATERTAYESEAELLAAIEKHLGVRP